MTRGRQAPVRFVSVRLSHPPGINRTYRSGAGRWYKTALAVQWDQDAMVSLHLAAVRPLSAGDYGISVELILFTCQLDIDAPVKLVLDTLFAALRIDDSAVGLLTV